MSNKLDVLAVINEYKSEGLSVSQYRDNDIIPYGSDNKYPDNVLDIIKKSPTANGCMKRRAEFIYGLGMTGGDVVVNRHNETLNEIYNIVTQSYARLNGFALHFNVNIFGQIVEIQNVDLRYVRKLGYLETAIIGSQQSNIYNEDVYRVTLWDSGAEQENGFLYYFGNGIYPVCPIESSLTSAQFEHYSQVFSYSSIRNGFSASGILKVPNLPDDVEKKIEIEDNIKKVVGPDTAGSVLLVTANRNIEGKIDNSSMFESFQLPNIDSLHKNQCERSREYILRDANVPEILLGVGSNGMFNKESFADAFEYYNNDTKRERMILQNSFNKFIEQSVFGIKDIQIIPLEDINVNNTN